MTIMFLALSFIVGMGFSVQAVDLSVTQGEALMAEYEDVDLLEEYDLDEPLRIGASTYGVSAEYMRLWATAFEFHPAYDDLVEITVYDGNYDASVQHSHFENMVAEEYDAIIYVPIDVEAGAADVELAHDNDIPVIGSNTLANSDLYTSYIGSDDVEGGYMQAKYVAEEIGGEGNVVILEGPIGQSAQIERREGNEKALEEYPDIEILDMQTANWSRAEALTIMEDWLVTYGQDIDGVIGQNDEMALGAIQAIQASGFSPQEFPTSGIDGISDALRAVQDGTHGLSILQDARAQAKGALDLALRELIGEEYEPLAPAWDMYSDLEWGDDFEENYWVPWIEVTPDNVGELMSRRLEITAR